MKSFATSTNFINKLNVRDAVDLIKRTEGKVCVITGAGVSTESGIPDYRGPSGRYMKTTSKPMTHQEFTGDARNRQRFWSRAIVGFRSFIEAQPNRSHHALAHLEHKHLIDGLITQNVDRLHHKAGSQKVIELHGRGDLVQCMSCNAVKRRDEYQKELTEENQLWLKQIEGKSFTLTADGDAIIEDTDLSNFCVTNCEECSVGVMKPTYVFYGGSVPPEVSAEATDLVTRNRALLMIGSTASTFSCYRLIQLAHFKGYPVGIVNRGPTRADDLATAGKFDGASCGDFLEQVMGQV
jgi:NAD-dependent SIR2 family protein deacetylase